MKRGDIMPCCGLEHLFDSRKVSDKWCPRELKCLILGESPGAPGAHYFYDPIPGLARDPVDVRRNLLAALANSGLISSPTLEAFKGAGFLFDHAIRCQLPMSEVKQEWELAKKYLSQRAAGATHLRPLAEAAQKVWVMGYIARNAVACLYPSIPRNKRKLTPPYQIPEEPKFFVSRYLTHTEESGVTQIVECVKAFLETEVPGSETGSRGA